MMKSLKTQMSFWLYMWVILVGIGVSHAVYANPDDPLEQLLRQRQQTQDNSSDGLEKLIRMKSAETPPAPALPNHQTTNSQKRTLRLSRSVENAKTQHAVAANSSSSRGDADALLSNAMGLLGVAYRFGGTSPRTGFDCSGFMQHIFHKAFAVNLPRTSAQQAQVGVHVSRSSLQPGDMVFFRTSGRRISHVGMYVGNNRFIHAPRTGKRIEITSLSSKYWNARYATARRVKR